MRGNILFIMHFLIIQSFAVQFTISYKFKFKKFLFLYLEITQFYIGWTWNNQGSINKQI